MKTKDVEGNEEDEEEIVLDDEDDEDDVAPDEDDYLAVSLLASIALHRCLHCSAPQLQTHRGNGC